MHALAAARIVNPIFKCEFFKAFRDDEIVPDVLEKAPRELVDVSFKNKAVRLGREIPAKETQEVPEIDYDTFPHTFYTLAMVDPDSPRRKNPTQKEWLGWLVVNIPGSQVERGEVIAEYVQACPPKFTDLHRYVFLVYEQPRKIDFDEENKSKTDAAGRLHFSISKFAEKYHLGDPVAGNFFFTEFDDSVASVHKKMIFS